MYSVKNVKSFIGDEGHGFNADLFCNNKKVCFVRDMAQGGEYDWDWIGERNAEVTRLNYKEEVIKYKGTEAERDFHKYLMALPKEFCEYSGKPRHISDDSFVATLVDEFENTKAFKRKCKNSTLVILHSHKKGEYCVWNRPYSQAMKNYVTNIHGKDLKEIINERF